MIRTIRLGAGAGFSGDRIEPAAELANKGDLDYLVFECLAERTIALAQQAKMKDPSVGYDPLLAARMRVVLPLCVKNRVKIITNMGAANPVAAAQKAMGIAIELGIRKLRIAAVTGDDALAYLRENDVVLDNGATVASLGNRVVSANAYVGAKPIADALAKGADVVITGRAADPALFMGPLIHEFGWAMDNWTMLGRGALVGHLLECAGQITGGYFADPGSKDIPGLARLGFPIGEVSEDGGLVVTKVEGSGGHVTPRTVKEQLLYEIHDPRKYFQPDVVADFSGVRVEQVGDDRVRVGGGEGAPKTGLLKTSVGYIDGYIGEGQISYAGPNAAGRGRLALDIVRERFVLTGLRTSELRFDIVGVDALHRQARSNDGFPYEIRVRIAGRSDNLSEAARIGEEVEALYTNGPAGGGGAWKSVREIIAMASALIPESAVQPAIAFFEA
jgi:hypothetical protein